MTQPSFTATLEAPDLVVMEATGRMTAVSMEVALDLLVPVVKGMRHGGALVRAAGVDWPTLGAVGVELRHWVQLMAMVRKLDRVAVLTDAFFNEFTVRLAKPAAAVVDRLAQRPIIAGVPVSRFAPGHDDLLILAATETVTDADIEALATALEETIR